MNFKIMLAIVIMLMYNASIALAYDCNFFIDKEKSEIKIVYKVSDYRVQEIYLYITDVSCDDGLVKGLTNSGKAYVPIDAITFVEDAGPFQHVHNHYGD